MARGRKRTSAHHEYYNLPEEEMQDLVARAQKGDEAAQNRLLQVFENFIKKYVNVIYHGNLLLDASDIRQFLKLFVTEPDVKRALGRNQISWSHRQKVNEVLRGIQYQVQRYGDEEDARQTVEMSFLQCVNIYQRKGDIPFSGFLYRYFLFVMKTNLVNMLMSQLGRKTFPLKPEHTGDTEDGELQPGFEPPAEPGVEEVFGSHEIDENWIIGESVMHPFDSLTVQERQILKWRFVDGDSTKTIAHRTTENPNTVRDRINTARDKIKQALARDELAN